MDIETAANPAGVEDTRVVETASVDASQGATAPAGGETQTEPNAADNLGDDLLGSLPAEPEEVEVDWEGAKYKVPAPLKDALLRQQDYTRKTMEVAEQRRAIEAQAAEVQQAAQLTAAEIRATARLESINSELAQYQNINWQALDPSDPEVQQARWRYDELTRESQGLNSQLAEHYRIKSQQAQQETAKRRDETDKALAREFKDWSPAKRQELETFATSVGIPAEALPHATVEEWKVLNLARIGSQFIERQRQAARAASQNAVRPAPEVGGTASAGVGDPSRMSMSEYIAARQAGKI